MNHDNFTDKPMAPSTLSLSSEHQGMRLDLALARLLPEYSRAILQKSLKQHYILLNNKPASPSYLVKGAEKVTIIQLLAPPSPLQAQNIPLTIVAEDEQLLIINKEAGMVVHPGDGNLANTLLNALLYYHPALLAVPRAGIVHRLDKDTSGLLVVAKTLAAYEHLTQQLRTRTMKRSYQAVIHGHPPAAATIITAMGRHHRQRTKMAVVGSGKEAITHYQAIAYYRHHSRLRVNLETGRTHQIRVHMHYIKHPIIGDPLYGYPASYNSTALPQQLKTALSRLQRQALHADQLGLIHPSCNTQMNWQIALPDDLQDIIRHLEQDNNN